MKTNWVSVYNDPVSRTHNDEVFKGHEYRSTIAICEYVRHLCAYLIPSPQGAYINKTSGLHTDLSSSHSRKDPKYGDDIVFYELLPESSSLEV